MLSISVDGIWDLIFLFAAGCAGGFISGLLGVGGGIIFVPILDYFLTKYGANSTDLVRYTLANSFLAIVVSGGAASFSSFRSRIINYSHLFSISISAIVFVLITSWLISIGTWYSPLEFKLFFSAMLLFTLIKTLLHIEADGSNERMTPRLGILSGMLTGIVAGLSGLGGGVIMIPLFMMFGNLTIKKASALSLAVIPLIALPNVIYYVLNKPEIVLPGSSGYIVWPVILPLLIGVFITVKAGLKLAHKLTPKIIKAIFACFIILTIIKTLASLLI